MRDKARELLLESIEAFRTLEGLIVAEEGHDEVGFHLVEPSIRSLFKALAHAAGSPTVFAVRQGEEFLGTRKGVRIVAAGVGAKARGIALIAEVADDELVLRKAEVNFSLKVAVVHHARTQTIADKGDAGVLLELEFGVSVNGQSRNKGRDAANGFHERIEKG